MTFLKDRAALVVGFLGGGLAILTLIWHVNPVEVSVMPAFLTRTALGSVLFGVLLTTSVPTWFAAFPLTLVLPSPVLPYAFVLVQALIYFLLIKLGRVIARWLSRKRQSLRSNRTVPGA